MPAPESPRDRRGWFERVWAHREDILYPELFGEQSRGIFPIQADMLTEVFQQETFDPRWLHYGVMEYGPTDTRESWLYVTSGMSNDWESEEPDPAKTSGLGCEFVFETKAAGDWAILRLLHLMTFQILLCHGRYPGREPLSDYDRLPLRGPIREGDSALTHLTLAEPVGFARSVQLASGSFVFYQVVGITEAEAAHARQHGGRSLIEALTAAGHFPVTDPDREETRMKDLGSG